VHITDLAPLISTPTVVCDDARIKVSAISVNHFDDSPNLPEAQRPRAVAYRVAADGKVYVYSGDTGPAANLELLAKGADVLLSELVELGGIRVALARTVPDAVVEKMVAGHAKHHSTPVVGTLARRAAVKRVVLTHFVPIPETLRDPSVLVREVSVEFSGTVELAHDLGKY
jgi:ribonuclease BN (tRNA processing enzyme)